ncbi:MAG: TetR/AcrR family transcriptional regulator [Solirubrobacteraceae bacterium]
MSPTDHKRPIRPYGGVSAEQRVAERRARLLDAALDEFGTRGVASTGVKDVCRRAGLTDRYFYESFRDSAELFMAVFDRATAHLLEVVVLALGGAPRGVEAQARAVIEAYVRALADDPRVARVVFIEAPSAGPELEAHMRVTLRRFAQLVVQVARPYLPDVPEETLRFGAISLVGAVERVMIEWQDGQLGLSIEQIIEYLVALLVAARTVARAPTNRPTPSNSTRRKKPR